MLDDIRRRKPRLLSRPGLPVVVVASLALLIGLAASAGLWLDPAARVFAGNVPDATHYQWWLGHTPHALGEGRSPLFTTDMNWPTGVSAMNNTTLMLPAVLLWPVTAAWGSLAALNVLNLLSVPTCALAAYWSLRRLPGPPLSRPASLAGATAFAISPAVVNSLVGHVTMSFAPALPVLVLLSVRAWSGPDEQEQGDDAAPAGAARGLRAWASWRVGVALGLVAAVQVLVGEEVLFQSAMGGLFVLIVAAASRPAQLVAGARRLAVSVAVALLVFLPLTVYPLYQQFFGRLHQHGNPFLDDYYGTDLLSFLVPTDQLLVHFSWSSPIAARFPGGIEEHLAYIGLPLLVTALVLVVVQRRSLPVRAAFVGLVVAAVLAVGGRVWINGDWTTTRGPYALLHKLPVTEASLATRFGMLVALFGASLLAFAVHALLAVPRRERRPWRPVLATLVALACLASWAPRPLAVTPAAAIPSYFTKNVPSQPAGEVLMVLPYPVPIEPVAMRWQSAAGYRFAMPGGYFLGPAGDGHAYVGGDADPVTAQLLSQVYAENRSATVNVAERQQAREDLQTLGIDKIVLGPNFSFDALSRTVRDLLGYSPVVQGGVYVWDDPLANGVWPADG
ncbi:hypothetical protein ACIB24_16920 [Spongisporangium articulatum]|uniref:YfhO family protein n=1 Tax=Spongisporangium articulatum TaxID=3362603 RepID=A0ABW8AQW0_9ACTN